MDIDEWLLQQGIDPYLFMRAFSEEVWIDPSLYVWTVTENALKRISGAIIHKTSPIIVAYGFYGVGKSALIHALDYTFKNSYGTGSVKIIEVPIRIDGSSEFMFLRDVADAVGLRDKFGGRYPRDRHDLIAAIEDVLKNEAERFSILTLIVDDAHFLRKQAYMSIKTICDIKKEGGRICPVVLVGEYFKIGEDLASGKLAQVKERVQERVMLRVFHEIDLFELVARAIAYSREEPLPPDWRFDPNIDMNRIRPFTPMSLHTLFQRTRGLPRFFKPVCRIAAEIRAEEADRLPLSERDKFIITPSNIGDAVNQVKMRRGER
jgi:type II secretory pathway predicted ATPase ExeA